MVEQRATKRQQELLSFVDGFIKTTGYGPSYREIMSALGYKSVSTVAIHIDGLIAKGYLARRDKSARSLEVVTLGPDGTARPVPSDDMATQQAIIKRIKTVRFTPEQSAQAAEVFEVLGMNEVVKILRVQESDG